MFLFWRSTSSLVPSYFIVQADMLLRSKPLIFVRKNFFNHSFASWTMPVYSSLMAYDIWNYLLSKTRSEAGHILDLATSSINLIPCSKSGNTAESNSKTSGQGLKRTTASVIRPMFPSEPMIIWVRSGPLDTLGQWLNFDKVPYKKEIQVIKIQIN
jgi:hypothetical protein